MELHAQISRTRYGNYAIFFVEFTCSISEKQIAGNILYFKLSFTNGSTKILKTTIGNNACTIANGQNKAKIKSIIPDGRVGLWRVIGDK